MCAGVTRQRLETFDRPIKEEPNFMGDKKDALMGEFRNYLGILKAVHSGADLNASAQAAGGALPGSVKGYLGYVVNHQQDNQILPLIENAVEARTELQSALTGNRWDSPSNHKHNAYFLVKVLLGGGGGGGGGKLGLGTFMHGLLAFSSICMANTLE